MKMYPYAVITSCKKCMFVKEEHNDRDVFKTKYYCKELKKCKC